MIQEYKKRKETEKENGVTDHTIMDNYIQVLTFLHKTNRFEQFFDPMRLKMMLIKPTKLDDPNYLQKARAQVDAYPNTFLAGCHLYQQGHYARAAEAFRKICESQDSTLYYESRFNLGACLFKMAEFKQALNQFTKLLSEQREAA